MADPPLLPGTVKVTETLEFAGVAVPMAGASGTVAGVALFEPAEAAPAPTLLVAITIKV
jgi:hypothetical protein